MQVQIPADGEHIRTNTILACAQQSHGGGIDADDFSVLIQQHHTLAHTADDGVQLGLLLFQPGLLSPQLFLLAVDPAEKGSKLVISLV